jgi:hypothetical protein
MLEWMIGAVRGPLVCGVSIELVVEDGADRAVGESPPAVRGRFIAI